MRRTKLIVVVERLARGRTERGDQADQRDKRQALQPAPTARAPRQSTQPKRAGQQNRPGYRADFRSRDVRAARGASLHAPEVCSSMELTGGQADGGELEGQLAGVVARISTLSGVKVQLASLGRPEHESVTNMGAVRAALSSGITVTAMVPAWPAVSESGRVDGATGPARA